MQYLYKGLDKCQVFSNCDCPTIITTCFCYISAKFIFCMWLLLCITDILFLHIPKGEVYCKTVDEIDLGVKTKEHLGHISGLRKHVFVIPSFRHSNSCDLVCLFRDHRNIIQVNIGIKRCVFVCSTKYRCVIDFLIIFAGLLEFLVLS